MLETLWNLTKFAAGAIGIILLFLAMLGLLLTIGYMVLTGGVWDLY